MKQHDLFGAAPAARPAEVVVPRDAAARRAAVTEFERPLLLEAGAGTGKTATLVARVLHWCLGPGWDAEARQGAAPEREEHAARVLAGVVAVTFTEAAAAGMSTRLGLALEAIETFASGNKELPPEFLREALPSDPVELGARAQALRASLDHLSASTIHAFCRRILAAHPFEGGVRPDFEVDATLRLAEVAVRDAIEALLLEAWEAGTDADWIELARRGFPPPEIEATAVTLVTEKGARADDFLGRDPLPEASCARALESLSETLAEFRVCGRELAGVGRKNASAPLVLAALDSTAEAIAAAGGPDRAAFRELGTRLRAIWEEGAGVSASNKVGKWTKGEFSGGEQQALGDHAAFSAAAAAFRAALEPYLAIDVDLLELGRRVLGSVLQRVEALLRERGVATFSDLLSGARALLADPAIAARERRRIRQLLVDEFQDTDEEQCEIIGRLALEGGEGPGLFLVGDPKQSIFAWRNADLAAYDALAARLEANGGRRLTLDANFRSRAAILEEVERLVAPMMEATHGVQPPFVPLEPARRDAEGAPAPAVEHWISWPRDPVSGQVVPDAPKGASYLSEARAVASDIARLQRAGQPLQECALILRSLNDVDVYLREFRQAGVAYEVQSDRNYYQRREVLDAAALVRTLLDPTDHLALVACLRSPAVGLPDAALLPLWTRGFPGEMTRLTGPQPARLERLAQCIAGAAEQVPAEIPGLAAVGGWELSLLAAVRAIARLRASFRRESADRFIEDLRGEFLPDAAEAARYLGEFRLANLERFFRELLGALEAAGGDARAVLRALRADLGRADRTEASRPGDSRRNAVQVLTIHGAKGLEFDHVYLAQTTHKKPSGDGKKATEFERRGGEVAYCVFGAATLAWAQGERLREEIVAAERVRLLYVMLTRAAKRLVIVGAWPSEVEPRTWRRAQHVNDLCRARPGAAQAVAEVARRNGGPHRDAFGVIWRVAEPSVPVAGPTGRPVRATGAPAGSGEARGLALERERAAVRMARSFSSAASSEAHLEAREFAARPLGEPDGEPALGRDAARAAGTAVHRLLEELDLEGDVISAWKGATKRLALLVRGPALERARELAERVAVGGFLERLASLASAVVARELPVILPPDPEQGAVGFVAGAVDLVYRDPCTGELVVVDFKTDRVESDEELAALAAGYRPQGAVYAAALEQALHLARTPRFELWFLHPGRVLTP